MLNPKFPAKDTQTEGVIEERDLLEVSVEDAELCKMAERYIADAEKMHGDKTRKGERNEAYWNGNQLDINKMAEFEDKTVNNRIFMSLETLFPILTARPNEPVVLPAQDGDDARKYAAKHEDSLRYYYQKNDSANKLKMMLRQWSLYYVGVIKCFIDEDTLGLAFKVVRPQKIYIDARATNNDEVNFVAEYCEDSLEDLKTRFPKAKKQLSEEFKGKKKGTIIGYYECWTNEIVFFKCRNMILEKKKNPYWDWKAGEFKEGKKIDGKEMLKRAQYNFLEEPRHPYFFFNVFNLGRSVYDDTSLVEQALSIQDSINKRKRQISDNADTVNGIVIAGSDAMSRADFARYRGRPGEKIYLEGGDTNAFKRLGGSPLPEFVFNDMTHSEKAIDDLIGVHATTRGEREGRETAKGRSILKDSDKGRIEYIGTVLDDLMRRVYEYWTQLMKVYFVEEHWIKISGKFGSKAFKFSKQSIQNGVEIQVLQGSSLPEDKASARDEALQLAQMGLIEIRELYIRLGWTDRDADIGSIRWYLQQTNPKVLYEGTISQSKEYQQMFGEGGMAQNLQVPSNQLPPSPNAQPNQPQGQPPQGMPPVAPQGGMPTMPQG